MTTRLKSWLNHASITRWTTCPNIFLDPVSTSSNFPFYSLQQNTEPFNYCSPRLWGHHRDQRLAPFHSCFNDTLVTWNPGDIICLSMDEHLDVSHVFFKSVLIWLDGPNHETTPNHEKQIKSKLGTPLQHWSSFYSRTKTGLTSSKFEVSHTFL